MCELSIIILFCDKDYELIPHLLERIEKNVPITHEVILIDNREKYIEFHIDTEFEIHTKNRNLYILEGRRWSLQFVSGRYVWFVDADDDIPPLNGKVIERLLSKGFDIISGGYIQKEDEGFSFSPQPSESPVYGKSIFTEELFKSIGVSLWNKWLKTELALLVYSKIPEGIEAVSNEDTSVIVLSLYYAKSFIHTNQVLYVYDRGNSLCCGSTISTLEHFNHNLKGYAETLEILKNCIPDGSYNNLFGGDKVQSDCNWFTFRISYCHPSIIKEAIKTVDSIFGRERILTSLHKISGWKNKEDFLPSLENSINEFYSV